jgi:hypothetical protein
MTSKGNHMGKLLPRLLLAVASLLLLLGGLAHAAAFKKASNAVEAANMTPFYNGSFKGLWLIDAARLVTLAFIFAFIAVRPATVSGAVVTLLALLPAGTAFVLYGFMGSFVPAHILLLCAALVGIAGILMSHG